MAEESSGEQSVLDIDLAELKATLDFQSESISVTDQRLGILIGAAGIILAALLYTATRLVDITCPVKVLTLLGGLFIGVSLVISAWTLSTVKFMRPYPFAFKHEEYENKTDEMKSDLIRGYRLAVYDNSFRERDKWTRTRLATLTLITGVVLIGLAFCVSIFTG